MARVNRRDMLQSGALASLFAVSGGPLLARGQRGGRLRAALSGATSADTWDMRQMPGLFMLAAASGAVLECLTEVSADGGLRGELATAWNTRDGGLTWEIHLRDGVTFHNGQVFGAEDVLDTFSTLTAGIEDMEKPILGMVAINVVSPLGLVITLERPNPNFPYALSHPQLAIHPRGGFASGVGTGLYAVRHFAPGARFLGARVDGHWKGQTAGFAEEVEFLSVDGARAQRVALKAGYVDIASDAGCALEGLRGLRGDGPVAMALHVQRPDIIGQHYPLDNARFAQRWWLG